MAEPARFTLRDLEVQELEIDPGISRFDLELYLEEKDQALHGFIAGSADLFDVSTIERMVGHFRSLLESIVDDPEQRISDVIVADRSAKRSACWFNGTTPRSITLARQCIHELFEEQVEQTPNPSLWFSKTGSLPTEN